MDAEELKSIQSSLKEQYANDPSSALVTLLAKGHAREGLSCNVETTKEVVEAGTHTLRAVATAMDIKLRDAVITAEGDLDFRGVLAVTTDAPVGFRSLRLQFKLDTGATEEQRETLILFSLGPKTMTT